MNKEVKKFNAYGTWSVITEGDCEGKSTKNLGTFRGFLDEIAFHLADECYYCLNFTPVKQVKRFDIKRHKVNVNLNIDSGTWPSSMGKEERINYYKEMLFYRPNISVEDGTSYASVTLVNNRYSQDDEIRRKALNKLTDKEKELLGLK